MKHLSRLMYLVIVIAMALSACGRATPVPVVAKPTEPPQAAPTSAAATSEVFKLGVDGPFSGPSALTGNEFKASVTMALEKINYQIGKYKIEPVWIDDQSDPAKGTQAYEQAVVQDKIQAGILNWNSSVAVALMVSGPLRYTWVAVEGLPVIVSTAPSPQVITHLLMVSAPGSLLARCSV